MKEEGGGDQGSACSKRARRPRAASAASRSLADGLPSLRQGAPLSLLLSRRVLGTGWHASSTPSLGSGGIPRRQRGAPSESVREPCSSDRSGKRRQQRGRGRGRRPTCLAISSAMRRSRMAARSGSSCGVARRRERGDAGAHGSEGALPPRSPRRAGGGSKTAKQHRGSHRKCGQRTIVRYS